MHEVAEIAAMPRRGVLRIKQWNADSTLIPERPSLEDLNVWALGPGDWLLVARTEAAFASAHSALSPSAGFAVVDVSDAFCTYRVAGSEAGTLLSKGCGLDFDVTRFAVGCNARTRFAQIALIVCRVESDAFELHVGRSYAHYLHAWLLDARPDVTGDE